MAMKQNRKMRIFLSVCFLTLLMTAAISDPIRTVEPAPLSTDFFVRYYQTSNNLAELISNVEMGADTALSSKNLEPDDSFRAAKMRAEFLMQTCLIKPPSLDSPFQKAAWENLMTSLAMFWRTIDWMNQSPFNIMEHLQGFQGSLRYDVDLFANASSFALHGLLPQDAEKLQSVLLAYPFIERGEPFCGALLTKNSAGDYEVIAVYPKSPADQAGMRADDLLQSDACRNDPSQVYTSVPVVVKRGNTSLRLNVTPVLYQFPNKPSGVGVGTIENDTKNSQSPQIIRNLISAYFLRSNNWMAEDNSLTFDSTPNAVADYAASHGLSYVLLGKVTRFDADVWRGPFRTGGNVIHIEAQLRLYDKKGILLGEKQLKSENSTPAQVDSGEWLAAEAKFINEALGPWLNENGIWAQQMKKESP